MAVSSSFIKTRNAGALTPEFLKYEEAIRKLNGLQSNTSVLQEARKRIGIKNDKHDNVKTTLQYLDRVGINLDTINDRIIHVSGTKGKGSTAMLTECLLRSVPYKTGLFVSPHLTSVRERISINGAPLTLTTFVHYFWDVYNALSQQKHYPVNLPSSVQAAGEPSYQLPFGPPPPQVSLLPPLARTGHVKQPLSLNNADLYQNRVFLQSTAYPYLLPASVGQKRNECDMPSYFKFLTIMALKVFISEKVDVAIIEVGIGGELDCTNVFRNTPIVGIASIGLDHTSILGNTEEKIAWQKAGILKPGSRAFTLPDHKESVLQVIQSRAVEKKSKLEIVPSLSEYSCDFSKLSLPKKLNVSLALQLAKAWGVWNNNREHEEYNRLNICEREQKAIKDCQIPGRCHIVNQANTTYYLDGAHTVESIKVAKEWFEENCPRDNKRILIFNVTGPRSAQTLLELLKDCQFSEAIFCTNDISSNPALLPVDFIMAGHTLEKEFLKAKENLNVWLSLADDNQGHAVPSVAEALTLAQSSSPVSALITGSLHLVGAALSLLEPC